MQEIGKHPHRIEPRFVCEHPETTNIPSLLAKYDRGDTDEEGIKDEGDKGICFLLACIVTITR